MRPVVSFAVAIREGETIAKPMKEFSRSPFHIMAVMFYFALGAVPGLMIMVIPDMVQLGAGVGGVVGFMFVLFYLTRMHARVVDDLVVNMVDVGEETGELDTMLYKVADTFDEEVRVLTDGLMALMEPLLIVFLGTAVGFIVISLFLPLVSLIENLSS